MTCLTLIQSVCRRVGLAVPNAVVTSTDQQVLQLLEFANEEGQELVSRYPWSFTLSELNFTTVASMDQILLPSYLGFSNGPSATNTGGQRSSILNNTLWNRDLRLPVYGVVSPQEWQEMQAMQTAGPYSRFFIGGQTLYMYPIPAAGQAIWGQVRNYGWVVNADPPSFQSDFYTYYYADSSYALLSEPLIALGVIWRWRAAKRLDYAEDFAKYEARLADEMARDAPRQNLNLTGLSPWPNIEPVVMVPSGSWMA